MTHRGTGDRPSGVGHRLALVTAGVTGVLIVAGGLVTNTGAALAVPDWPTTFGHNMFLFPWSGMVGGVLYEHSHRLLGALVGLLTLALAAVLWVTERRRWLGALGVAAVALVGVQGLLGGLRVLARSSELAIIHGCLAQAFFALAIALCVFTSTAWRSGAAPIPVRGMGHLPWLSVAGVGVVYLQIVFGALATHAGWMTLHLGGALGTTLVVGPLAGWVLRLHAGRPELAGPARVMGLLLVVQLAL
ncbi:MAG: COX15/CtaA family protein, partial [Candidatus Rokuibacteriota bacterium]